MVSKTVARLNATMFCINSDMEAARSLYDYLVMLHEGRVVWHGPTGDIDTADNSYLQQMINGQAEGPIQMQMRAADAQP